MENKKTHWKKLVNPNYIGAYSLENGKDKIVKIKKVVRETVTSEGGKKEECTVAYLENEKPFILNRTNSKTITKIAKSPYIEDWIGISIKLFVSTTKLKGEEVECLRIREERIEVKKLELIENSENWNQVVTALSNGYTIEQIKSKYQISNNLIKKLKEHEKPV